MWTVSLFLLIFNDIWQFKNEFCYENSNYYVIYKSKNVSYVFRKRYCKWIQADELALLIINLWNNKTILIKLIFVFAHGERK